MYWRCAVAAATASRSARIASYRRTSASSRRCIDVDLGRHAPARALRRMLAMRLLAAVRLAASGSSRKRAERRRRASKSSGEAGRVASTASNISVRHRDAARRGAGALEVVGAQALHQEVVDLRRRPRRRRRGPSAPRRAPPARSRSMSARTAASAWSIRRCRSRSRSLLDEDALHAERRAAQPERILGAASGFSPMAKMPASVSSLSAIATAMPVRVAGSASPAPRGR